MHPFRIIYRLPGKIETEILNNKTISGMTRYGRKSMPAGSTPGSAPGVENVFPSMIKVGDGKLGLEGNSIMDFPFLLS